MKTNLLLTTDYARYEAYNRLCMKYGFSYIENIKREQRFLKRLLQTKYAKTKRAENLRVLVYIHADFGKRTAQDYKICALHSPDYRRFIQTDDYDDLFSLIEADAFFGNLT